MKDRTANRPTLEELLKGLYASDRMLLSRAITIIESKLPSDLALSKELLDEVLLNLGKTLRIGITGVPGVGKSTFIEAFGNFLTSLGKQVAILTVDPSSGLSKGSILGDKTRMEKLSMNPRAYIRPSPAGKTLGGVASNTREAILLCEAAGFDIIIVETVGVGQSETMVKEMVDFFLLLMIPGAGDELQGIKRGVIEMADTLVINKADKKNLTAANLAQKAYQNALHLYPQRASGWQIPVLKCSSLENTGISEIWKVIEAFTRKHEENGWLKENRKQQNLEWLDSLIQSRLINGFFTNPKTKTKLKEIQERITAGEISVRRAVDLLFS